MSDARRIVPLPVLMKPDVQNWLGPRVSGFMNVRSGCSSAVTSVTWKRVRAAPVAAPVLSICHASPTRVLSVLGLSETTCATSPVTVNVPSTESVAWTVLTPVPANTSEPPSSVRFRTELPQWVFPSGPSWNVPPFFT